MVRTSPLVRFAICAAALALAIPTLSAQTPRAAAPARVQARYTKVTDALGFLWDVNSNGAITRGSNCFNGAFWPSMDGNNISLQSGSMTADGLEYFFTGENDGLSVNHRVRVNLKESYCRFIETLTNNSGDVHTFQFGIRMRLANRLVANGGDAADRDIPFGEKETGAIIVGSAKLTTPQPSVVWMVASRGAKIRPTMRIEQGIYVTATYPVTLAPGASLSFVHAAAQRAPVIKADAKVRAELFAPLLSPRLLADLPAKERKEFANFTPVATEDDSGTGLVALHTLLEAAGITREKSDALMAEPGAVITGKITGGDVTIETEFGKSKVPFADIAAIAGGAGMGRTPRVFLRDGEILSGAVSAEKFTMTTLSGLSLEADLALIHLLSLAKAAPDGQPHARAAALLTTHGGDCLALAADGTAALDTATPWGPCRVPLAEITSLTTVRDPVPGQRLALTDGSRLPVMLRGGEWPIATVRFGTVKIATQSVRDIRSLSTKSAAPPGEAGQPAADFAKCELTGENRLAGVIAIPKLHLASANSTTPLDSFTIVSLERAAGEDGVALVKIKLADGQEISGRLVESILPIRSADRVWRVPAAHILSVSVPPPPKPTEDAPASPAPAAPAAAPAPAIRPPPRPPGTDEILNAPLARPPIPAPKSPPTAAAWHRPARPQS